MGGTGVIDGFLATFTQYIDSGFGLVQGDVRWLASVLIAIDITLAGLFWAMAPDEDVFARLIRKTLYIGVFAFIIGKYNNLAQIIYNSFAGLGIKAGGGTITAAQLLQPGKLAQVGIDSGKPILTSISGLIGFTSFFDNFVQIAILLIAWLIVVISFFHHGDPTLRQPDRVQADDARRLRPRAVRSLRPHRLSRREGARQRRLQRRQDSGAGGDQLGAGAAVGTGLAVAGLGAAGVGLAAAGVGAVGAAGGAIAGTARGGAALAGAATNAYRAGGIAGVAEAAGSAAVSPLRSAVGSMQSSFVAGGAA